MAPKISLPSMEFDFEVSVIGETTGQLYEGSFSYKRPNLGEIRRARTARAHLNEDLRNLDEETQLLNEMLSWLSVSITKAPPWWNNNGWDMYDFEVVQEIYIKVLEYEKSFKKKIENKGKKKVEKDSK